jgi:hypothetical protein
MMRSSAPAQLGFQMQQYYLYPPPPFRPLVDVCSTASCAAPTGRVPGIRGAFIIASTPCSCVGVLGDQP